jgi:hypothetical protein
VFSGEAGQFLNVAAFEFTRLSMRSCGQLGLDALVVLSARGGER